MRVANDDHDIMSVSELMKERRFQNAGMPYEELRLVARALLPAEIVEGCTLHYELMQYTIL